MTTTSWLPDGGNSRSPRYVHQAFHKSHYQAPSQHDTSDEKRDHRLTRHFQVPGVLVKHRGQPQEFVYGSGTSYSQRGQWREKPPTLNQTSTERIRLRQHHREAEEDILSLQVNKAKMAEERAAEKQKDLEQLQSYKPWGRPAPGAPRLTPSGTVNARRRKLDFEPTEEHTSEYHPFGRPGGGAPLKTNSGHLVTTLRADPDTRFQKQLKREVEGPMRYRGAGSEGAREEHVVQRTDSEKERIVQANEKKIKYARKLAEQQNEFTERKAQLKAEEKAALPAYNPWGRDKPMRNESGRIPGRKWMLKDATGLGENILQQNQKQTTSPARGQHSYDPWGKPGAGAPIIDERGHMVTALNARCIREQMGTDGGAPLWLRAGAVDKSQKNPHTRHIVAGSKSTSEVTAQKLDIRRLDNSHSREYFRIGHLWGGGERLNGVRRNWEKKRESTKECVRGREYCSELQQMMNEREEWRKKLWAEERENERKHLQAFDQQWGKPGAGAPRLDQFGNIDTTPKNMTSLLETHVHNAWHFRRS